jgi:PAS domain S-box-containing protein
MHDITDRKRALAELHEAQAALLQAEQIARLGYATLDLAARRWAISPTLAALLGLPAGTPLPYEESWHVVHPDDRAALNAHLERDVLGARKPYDHEFRIIRASDGEVRWMHAVGHTEGDAGGRVTRLFATLQDVTERKLATLALEHSREELRRLSASVTWAREAERRHVARELHDELGQRLSALKLDLATLLAHAGAQPGDTALRMQHLVGSVDEAIAATRRIAADLRPSMLDDLGLNAALEWLADGWSRRTGVTITVEGDPVEDSLSEAGAITVYRIVQEALTNVTRHAQARHAHIGLRHHDAELVLVVEDDGRGLAPGDMDKRESSGLAGIRERARILGGRASIDNRPQGGCRLEVRVPFERVDSTRGVLEGSQ